MAQRSFAFGSCGFRLRLPARPGARDVPRGTSLAPAARGCRLADATLSARSTTMSRTSRPKATAEGSPPIAGSTPALNNPSRLLAVSAVQTEAKGVGGVPSEIPVIPPRFFRGNRMAPHYAGDRFGRDRATPDGIPADHHLALALAKYNSQRGRQGPEAEILASGRLALSVSDPRFHVEPRRAGMRALDLAGI